MSRFRYDQAIDDAIAAVLALLPLAGDGWLPIATAPKHEECWFWIRPLTAEESFHDSSGNPIVAMVGPRKTFTVYGRWSSLMTAVLWQPGPSDPPSPPLAGDAEPKEPK